MNVYVKQKERSYIVFDTKVWFPLFIQEIKQF